MPFLYITEPDSISLDDVVDVLRQANLQPIAGNPSFNGSHDHDFETIVIRSGTTVDSTIRQYFPALKNVVRIGTGLDNVDLEFCRANDIHVYNAAGANAEAVAEYVVCMMLYALRKIHLLTTPDIEQWNRFKFEGRSLDTQTVGIVGFGNIGRALYRKLSGFTGLRFLAYDPYLTQDKLNGYNITLTDLPNLLAQSNIVSLHLPLTDDTKHIINAENLATLPKAAILINAARGGIVDEQALLNIPTDNALTYVADAVENEPHPRPELLTNENIIITPHIGALTDSSERAMVATAIDNFLQNRRVS